MLFFSSYPVTCVSFLQHLLYRSPSASFYLVFHTSCTTCRCIFDVFVRGGELHILLLCHLDLPHKGLFLDFPFYYIYLYTYPMSVSCFIDYYSFVVSCEIEKYYAFNFIFFQECFGYSEFLAFTYEF